MNKRSKALIVMLVFLGLIWYFFFEIAIPYAAKANIPSKWRNIPLGQQRLHVHEYLGSPQNEGWDVKGDEWSKPVKRNTIFLNIGYNRDTIARRYRIGFVYDTWFGKRTYTLERGASF